MLSEVGYESYGFDYGDRNIYDCDRVAYVIAKKQVNNNLVYCIVIRGTSGYEWFSNFNLGRNNDGDHEGFHKAAREVEATLATDLGPNTIVWVTGHSRGAAVAVFSLREVLSYRRRM